MSAFTPPHLLTWAIAGIATAGVIARPFGWPEAVWAVAGAALLVALGLLPAGAAWAGIARGDDVYLFLTGMMLLAETARAASLFDWLAALAARRAAGSPRRMFLLIYGVGVVITVFLSNDATAVVLTPAVAAVTRATKVAKPLPYLLICAFIANAASFVLPISNPANLVIYGSHMPPLADWLDRFALPSVLAIGATYGVLYWTQLGGLAGAVETNIAVPALSAAGQAAGWGIAATAVVLLACSALDLRLGLPTATAGTLTAAVVLACRRAAPWDLIRNVSWSVLALVAGLFVLVEALDRTGVIVAAGTALRAQPAVVAGVLVALASNAMNNLPVGLIAGHAAQDSAIASRLLIGVDLGPNLSVTGSLATILWLTALRREGVQLSGWTFLKLGALVMPPALLLALVV